MISITLDTDWKEPKTNSEEDILASERAEQFKMGWFAHPIFKTGDYPPMMKERVLAKSIQQGLPKSRLPEFTAQEKDEIKGMIMLFSFHVTFELFNEFGRFLRVNRDR